MELKLTVKKEVFENLAKGKQNYIYLDGNAYWTKRLAKDVKSTFERLCISKEFKEYDTALLTCGKSKSSYAITNIRPGFDGDESGDDGEITGYLVFVNTGEVPEEYNESDTEETTEEVPTETAIPDSMSGYLEVTEELKQEVDLSTVNLNLEDNINFIIDIMGGYDNVYIVNRPSVVIFSGGNILGCNAKLNVENDQEIRFDIGEEVIVDDTKNDDEFLTKIEQYFLNFARLRLNTIFIYQKGCKLTKNESGERVFKVRVSVKRFK